MLKTVAIISSTALFSLIGLFAGYVAINRLNPGQRLHDEYVMMMAIAPTLFGAMLGFAVGCFAASVSKKSG